ncbi:MAG: hypothetical protein WCI05_08525 [Myxococcales bacterium]
MSSPRTSLRQVAQTLLLEFRTAITERRKRSAPTLPDPVLQAPGPGTPKPTGGKPLPVPMGPVTAPSSPLGLGRTLTFASGRGMVTLTDFVGSSGDSDMYRSTVGVQPVIVVWLRTRDTGAQQRLASALRRKAPTASFLWPTEIVSAPDVPGFGAVIPMDVGGGFVPLGSWLATRPPLRRAATVAFHLASDFLSLHTSGFLFGHPRLHDFLVHPDSAELRIAGCERMVGVSEGPWRDSGTGELLAPELLAGSAPPGTQGDLHSLAVLMFLLLAGHHPFLGKRALGYSTLDTGAVEALCRAAVFLLHPSDRSNEAVPLTADPTGRAGGHALARWNVLPGPLQHALLTTLVDGVRNPSVRTPASVFRLQLARLLDAIFQCPKCGADRIYDLQGTRQAGGAPVCPSCGQTTALPARIRVRKNVVVLPAGAQLFSHHLDPAQVCTLMSPIAEVCPHPSRPGVLGLRNLTPDKWVVARPDGSLRDVDPGRSVLLESGTTIQFGRADGEVRMA